MQLSSAELHRRTVERRAVDAVKQAAFRDGKATSNAIVWWPKGAWKNQSPAPNVNTRYLYFFIDGDDLVRQVKVHPLSQAANSPAQHP